MNKAIDPTTSVPMHPVQSSNLAYVGYDAPSQCLFVTFQDKNGNLTATWRYDTVPQRIADELRGAASVGGYFARNVKGRYPETKIKG